MPLQCAISDSISPFYFALHAICSNVMEKSASILTTVQLQEKTLYPSDFLLGRSDALENGLWRVRVSKNNEQQEMIKQHPAAL